MSSPKGKRYTLHEGELVDITDDKRPTAFDYDGSEFPIRIVKDWQPELLLYISKLCISYSITMRLSGEHAKCYQTAMDIHRIIYDVLNEDEDNS